MECGGSEPLDVRRTHGAHKEGGEKVPGRGASGGAHPWDMGHIQPCCTADCRPVCMGCGQRAQETVSAVREQGAPSKDVEGGSRHDFSPTKVRRRSQGRGITWRPTGCSAVSAASPLRRTTIAAVVDLARTIQNSGRTPPQSISWRRMVWVVCPSGCEPLDVGSRWQCELSELSTPCMPSSRTWRVA